MSTPVNLADRSKFFPLTPPDSTARPQVSRYNPYGVKNPPVSGAPSNTGLAQPRRYRRHQKILRDNIPAALNKPVIRRLARRGGVRRIQIDIYPTAQVVALAYLRKTIGDVVLISEHCKRKTVTALDVVYALRKNGAPIYGFGTVPRGENIHSRAQYMRDKRVRERKAAAEYAAKFDAEQREREAREAREFRNRNVDVMERAMRAGARRW